MPVALSPSLQEGGRLEALARYNVLDTGPETAFDDIVELAKQLCVTPIALVSLVTANRQWFKAETGLGLCETPISQSVCAHVVAEASMVVIPDLTADPRTCDNTLVTQDPYIRFYAGAPLTAPDGFVLGSLCVIDYNPRPEGLSEAQSTALAALSRQVIAQLELRRALHSLEVDHAAARTNTDRQAALLVLGDIFRAEPSKAKAIAEAARILGQTLGVPRSGYARIDLRADAMMVEADWVVPGMESLAGRHSLTSFPASIERLRKGEALAVCYVAAESWLDSDAMSYKKIGIQGQIMIPLLQGAGLAGVLYAQSVEPRNWTPSETRFAHAVADRLHAFLSKREAEEHQRLLDEELSHRLKNTLALVQAIAGQTLRQVTERDAVKAFERRIMALSKAHDVLLHQGWAAARIKPTIEGVLSLSSGSDQIVLVGPDINLGSAAVSSLSLLLHELATNAAKYGSLCSGQGRVTIAWSITGGAKPDFILRWTEQGGPPAYEPADGGFGTRLIKMGLVGTADVQLHFNQWGLDAEFRAPLSLILQP